MFVCIDNTLEKIHKRLIIIFVSGDTIVNRDRHENEDYFLLCILVYNSNFCHVELKTKRKNPQKRIKRT